MLRPYSQPSPVRLARASIRSADLRSQALTWGVGGMPVSMKRWAISPISKTE
jgi:hypothetical protein